jgi:hypothetical protein
MNRKFLLTGALVAITALSLSAAGPGVGPEPPSKPGEPFTKTEREKLRAEGKTFQQAKELWRSQEFMMSFYGAATADGVDIENADPGAGLGVDYFFTRNIGLSLAARHTFEEGEYFMNRMSLSLIYRKPIGPIALYGGVGAGLRYQDHEIEPRFSVTAGAEYRFIGNVGVFADLTLITEDFSSSDPNVVRVGFKVGY